MQNFADLQFFTWILQILRKSKLYEDKFYNRLSSAILTFVGYKHTVCRLQTHKQKNMEAKYLYI